MPARKVRVQYQGREVEGEKVPVESMREEWNQYFLADGTVVRARLIVQEVIRLNGEYNSEGDPVYIVKSTNLVSTDVPDSLKRKD